MRFHVSALLSAVGCQATAPGVATQATLVPSDDIVTVATLHWTTSEPVPMRVRYGTPARTFETGLVTAEVHEEVLVGVPASTEVTWEVLDQRDTVLASGTWTTGALPAELPTLTTTGEGQDQFMFTPILGGATAAVMLSPEGEIVWYHLDDSGLDVYRVRPARDGTGVWYNAASVSGDPADDSRLVYVPWAGGEPTALPVALLAHDFVEAATNDFAALQVFYDGDVRGDALVRVRPGVASQDLLWTSWDCFDPSVTPGDEPALGWTFANALDQDTTPNQFVVGLRNLSSIAWVGPDRACHRILGGDLSEYTFSGGRFLHQHQFDAFRGEDGLDHVLVFDNEGAGGSESRVIEYALDDEALTATEVWSYTPSPSIYSFVLGDVQRLDDGDTFVAWSVAGQLDRVSPAGEPTWSLNTGVGYAFGFVTLAPTPLPTPETQP